MAKKRLNKKVAIFGAVILLALAVLAAFIIYRRFLEGPDKYLAQAKVEMTKLEGQLAEYRDALKSPAGLTDNAKEQMLEAGNETCLNAIRMYRTAYGKTKGDIQKIELLFTMSEFHLENNEFHEPEWDKAIRTWNTVINIDPKNIEARMKLVDYSYTLADSGAPVWARVKNQVAGTQDNHSQSLIQIMAEKQMEPDPFVLMAKARAGLQLAASGEEKEPAKTIEEAISDFQELLKLTPGDIKAYKFLSDAMKVRGEIRNSTGYLNAREEALVSAQEILEKAIEAAPENPAAYINLLQMKFAATRGDMEKMTGLGPDFEALIDKFPNSGEAYSALADYYQNITDFDKAIEAITRAMELDKDNVEYAIAAAFLNYRKSQVEKDDALFQKALSIADNALSFPDAQDIPGPRQYRYITNRHNLLSFLSRLYTERALDAADAGDEEQQKTWVLKAQKTVDEIVQIYGTEDNVSSVMWRGILALAQGDTQPAIQKMYDAYEQLKTIQSNNPVLAYTLSRALQNRPEIGTRMEFLGSAIRTGITQYKPDALLEYAELILKIRGYSSAIQLANMYEAAMPPNIRSRAIQTEAFISTGDFEKAKEILNQISPDTPEAKSLQLSLLNAQIVRLLQSKNQQPLSQEEQQELQAHQKSNSDLVKEVLTSNPDLVSINTLAAVGDYYLAQGNTAEPKILVDKFIANSPNNVNAIFYKYKLREPDPLNISAERLAEITPMAIKEIKDDIERPILLATNYLAEGKKAEAVAELKKANESLPDNKRLIDALFETALSGPTPDLQLAQEAVDKAVELNLDECDGNFYLARMDVARSDYENALNRVNQCIKTRPLYSSGYLLRSKINDTMGNYDQSIEDALTAAGMNPINPQIAKQKISVLLNRNNRLGRNVTKEQQQEAETALREGIIVSPGDWNLQSLYAEQRSKEHPEEALATRQYLQQRYPNLTNHFMLGDMAMKIAVTESDKDKKAGYFEIAGSAYKSALDLDPNNKTVLEHYSEYLRITGQQSKIADIFSGQKDLLWQFYLRDGQYGKANEILGKLYDQDPQQAVVLRGLALVALRTRDTENMVKYSEELLAVENTKSNELMQMQYYIDSGLVKEATLKLASFRERYPQESLGILLEAWVATINGQLNEALQLVNRYLEEDSDNSEAWRLRGKINLLAGKNGLAVDDLQKSKSLTSNATTSMDLARAYRNSNRMPQAIGELLNALKDEMAPLNVRTLLEQFYREDGRKSDLKKFYQECIAKYPDSEEWYFRSAQFYLNEDDTARAEQLLEKAWEITKTNNNLSGMVFDLYLETLWLSKQYEKVISIASEYIDSPLASIAYSQMGQTQAKTSNKSAAVEYYYKALGKCEGNDNMIKGVLRNMQTAVGSEEVEKWVMTKLASDPDSLIANIVMFNLIKQKGEYNKALKYLDKAMSVAPPADPQYYQYSILKANTLVLAFLKTSDKQYLSQAITDYQNVLETVPNHTITLNNLAYLLADYTEDYTQAQEYASQAYAASPNNPNIIDTYAYTLCKTSNYSKAEELLLTALQLHETQGTAVPSDLYNHLGMAQEGLGRNIDAAESYKQAIEAGGNNLDKKNKEQLTEAIKRVSQ